jgi:ATP-binding cassette subfamily G (WHITE) protein 2
MAALKKLAGTQRTIVAVIHQPRSSIFNMLDELILISEGRTIFIGPAEKAVRHFEAQGFVCPPQYNAADLFLDSVSMDYRTEALEHVTRQRIAQLADTWRNHPYPGDNDEEASDAGLDAPALVRGPSCKDLADASYISPQDRGGWFNNLYYLTWRAGKTAYRNNFAIGLRILLNVIFALIFSGLWHDVRNNQTGIQSLVGIIFMCATNVAFTNTQAVINSFPREKGIVQKEQASNAYSLSAYYLSKFFSELPLNLLGPSIFSSMVFWIIHFNHSLVNYGIFLATMCLSALSAIGLGTLISTLAPNTEVAAALSPAINVLFLLFSGVLINTQSLPAGARWVASISPIKWTVNALALNEFTGANFACTEPGQRCLATGEEVLSLYSWDDTTIGHSMLSIVLIMCGLLTLGYLVLRLSLPRYIKAEEKDQDDKQQQPSQKREAQVLAVVS